MNVLDHGVGLIDWITTRRTDGAISVTGEAVRTWIKKARAAEVRGDLEREPVA